MCGVKSLNVHKQSIWERKSTPHRVTFQKVKKKQQLTLVFSGSITSKMRRKR